MKTAVFFAIGLLVAIIATSACSSQQNQGSLVTSKCMGASFPASTEVSLIGLYGGLRKQGARPASDGIESPTVRLNLGYFNFLAKPQIFVLSAYEPISWDLSEIPKDKVLGVATYSYNKQTILNLPLDVPLKQISYRDPKAGVEECGPYFNVHKGGPELDRAVEQVEHATGLKVTRFLGSYRAEAVLAKGYGQQPAALEEGYLFAESGPFVGVDPREAPDRAPGLETIRKLIAEGKIRAAKQEDIDAWNERATKKLNSGHLKAYKSQYLQRPHSYVVIGAVDLPEDMHFRHFIYLDSTPEPKSVNPHLSYYFMRTGTCGGAAADCPGGKFN